MNTSVRVKGSLTYYMQCLSDSYSLAANRLTQMDFYSLLDLWIGYMWAEVIIGSFSLARVNSILLVGLG